MRLLRFAYIFFFKMAACKQHFHSDALKKLCCVCGTIFKGFSYNLEKVKGDLCKLFGKQFEKMLLSSYVPERCCQKCFMRVKNNEKNFNVDKDFVNWCSTDHATTEDIYYCKTCEVYVSNRKGGRPSKGKNQGGRPKNIENLKVVDLLNLKEGASLSKEVDRCIGHALKLKIKSSELPNGTVQFQTGGSQVKNLKLIIISFFEKKLFFLML